MRLLNLSKKKKNKDDTKELDAKKFINKIQQKHLKQQQEQEEQQNHIDTTGNSSSLGDSGRNGSFLDTNSIVKEVIAEDEVYNSKPQQTSESSNITTNDGENLSEEAKLKKKEKDDLLKTVIFALKNQEQNNLKKKLTVHIPAYKPKRMMDMVNSSDRPRKLSNAFDVELLLKLKQTESDYAQSLAYAVSPFQYLTDDVDRSNSNGYSGESSSEDEHLSNSTASLVDNNGFKIDLNFDGYSDWYRDMMDKVKLKIKQEQNNRKDVYSNQYSPMSSPFSNTNTPNEIDSNLLHPKSQITQKKKEKTRGKQHQHSNSTNTDYSVDYSVGESNANNEEEQMHLDFLKRHENKTTVTSPSTSTPLSTSQPKRSLKVNLNSSMNLLDMSLDSEMISDSLSNTGSDINTTGGGGGQQSNISNVNHHNSHSNLFDILMCNEFPILGEATRSSNNLSQSSLKDKNDPNYNNTENNSNTTPSNHRNLRRLNSSQTIFHKFQRNSSSSNLLSTDPQLQQQIENINNISNSSIKDRDRLSLDDNGPVNQHNSIRSSYSNENLKLSSSPNAVKKIGEKIISFFTSSKSDRKSKSELQNSSSISSTSNTLLSNSNSNSSIGNLGSLLNQQQQMVPTLSSPHYLNRTHSSSSINYSPRSSNTTTLGNNMSSDLLTSQSSTLQIPPLNRSQSHISLQSAPQTSTTTSITPRANGFTPRGTAIKYSPPILSPNNSFMNLDVTSPTHHHHHHNHHQTQQDSNNIITKNHSNNNVNSSTINNNNNNNNNNNIIENNNNSKENQLHDLIKSEFDLNHLNYNHPHKLNNNNNNNNVQILNNQNNNNNIVIDDEDDDYDCTSSTSFSSRSASPMTSPESSPPTENEMSDENDRVKDIDDSDDDDELSKIREARMKQLREESKKKQELLNTNGEYKEILEQEFLKEVTSTLKVVVHFYHKEFQRCKIVDKHLQILAKSHYSTKFLKMDAEKSMFFIEKLGIRVLPTIVAFRNGVVVDKVVGFDELGGVDDFKTDSLAKRLAQANVVDFKYTTGIKVISKSDVKNKSLEADD
ncbi:hypothetical protein DLAC_00629 [Tieghemostelium lacteum]|uniref:Thioredoxin domain-containing protein n=1 Tax=Tieghemostelium lacteum TaxID=361077 RepID=A0A152AAH5_TIELA|nr:hypothetical protein DLAC_00629 [Tieghemostelium lacteum]|eukprot:KYR03131.1 hypothetical protein DLAC_00629 [Tieghemostelium lacteum]